MKKVGVVLLSGACCNPAWGTIDDQIRVRVTQVAAEERVELLLKTVSIAGAALGGGLGLGQQVDDQVRSLIAKRGMGVLPIVFINGALTFSGGVPSTEEIREKIQAAQA